MSSIITFSGSNTSVNLIADFEGETIWATQSQIADLFGVSVKTVSLTMSKIFTENELDRLAVTNKKQSPATGAPSDYYNLDMIISIGYRINSTKATEFRKWATAQIKELIINGFVIDEHRFAKGQLEAFQKLVERVRAIRTSEQHFYKKISDIFAMSTDYNSNSQSSRNFFASIQNKFHYAIHGNTAAELIVKRIDSNKANMGMTSLKGDSVTREDAKVAKNYLSELELKRLELLSEQFLSFAELRYTDKKAMSMSDWESKLEEFLNFNEKAVLYGKGKVSNADKLKVIETELNSYKSKQISTGKRNRLN